jgi:hypothetical protein
MTKPGALKSKDQLEKLTLELILQLLPKFNQFQRELHNAEDPAWMTWLFDERPYPLASSIVGALKPSSLEESDIIYLITMSIVSHICSEPRVLNNGIMQIGDAGLTKVVERLRAPAKECHFTVPISVGNSLPLSLNIGGPHQLKIHRLGMKENSSLALAYSGASWAPIPVHRGQ